MDCQNYSNEDFRQLGLMRTKNMQYIKELVFNTG